MRGPVRKAIDDGKYNLGIVWEKLDVQYRNALLSWVRAYSDYGKEAHMGMLPLLSVKTVFKVLDRADYGLGQYHGYGSGYSLAKKPALVEKIRTIIRLQIKRDLKLQEHLAKLRARERHTV